MKRRRSANQAASDKTEQKTNTAAMKRGSSANHKAGGKTGQEGNFSCGKEEALGE